MRKTLIMLSSLALSSLAIVGCDQRAAQTAEAQVLLDTAMAQIDKADNSFDPSKNENVTFDEYRNAELAKALKDLNQVQKTGADYQVVSASQLKADILLSNSRHELSNAKKLYAQIGPKAASLLRYVVAVDEAESTVNTIDNAIDVSPILNTASSEIKAQQQRIDQLAVAAKELQEKLDAINKKKQAFVDQSQTHFANARELKNKAFTTTGDITYKLQAEASAEVRKADQASAEADKLDAAAELLKVALSLNETESKAAANVVAELNDRKAAAKQESSVSKQNLQDAKKQRDVLYESFRQEFNKITLKYNQEVIKGFEAAVVSANDAVSALSTAASKAKNNRRAVNFDQLVAYCELANVLSEQAATAANFGEVINVIIDNNNGINTSITPEELAVVKTFYTAIAKQQSETIKLAEEAIASAKDIYEQVADDENAQYKVTLTTYQTRLQDAALK